MSCGKNCDGCPCGAKKEEFDLVSELQMLTRFLHDSPIKTKVYNEAHDRIQKIIDKVS